MRALSHSSISMYLECPLKFKLKYIDDLPEKPKSYLSFGRSLHDALEFMYSYRPPPPSLEQVLKFYEEHWIEKGYASKEEEEGYFAYGRRILSEYYKANVKDLRPPVAVEFRFELEVDGIPVTGFIDRVDKGADGKVEVIDYKSGKNIFDRSQVEENEQLTMYQMAVEEGLGLPVGRLTLYHLPSQTPVSSEARTEQRIRNLKARIKDVAHRIEAGEFLAKKNRFCRFCDYQEHCPYFRHLHLKKSEPQSKKKKINIQQTIEEYSELKEKERELKQRIGELAENIHSYCEEKGLARLFGDEHAVTRICSERKGFDKEKLKELLEPKGLWERLLSYDDSLTKELLKSDEIDEELKIEIRKLEEVKRTVHQLRVKGISEEENTD